MLYYKRRKKAQNGEEVTFIDDLGDQWTEFIVYHHKFKEWMDYAMCNDLEIEAAVQNSPYCKATANEISKIVAIRGDIPLLLAKILSIFPLDHNKQVHGHNNYY